MLKQMLGPFEGACINENTAVLVGRLNVGT